VKRVRQSSRNHIYYNLVCSPFERMVGNKKGKGRFRSGHRGPLNTMGFFLGFWFLSKLCAQFGA